MRIRALALVAILPLALGLSSCSQAAAAKEESALKEVEASVTQIKDSFAKISDMDSAKAAVAKIKEVAPKLKAASTVVETIEKGTATVSDALKAQKAKAEAAMKEMVTTMMNKVGELMTSKPEVAAFLSKEMEALKDLFPENK